MYFTNKEEAELIQVGLSTYIGQKVMTIDYGKVYDYHHSLAKKIVPSHLQWAEGMYLDNGDTAYLEEVVVDYHAGDDSYRVICLISSECGQAYLYGHDGIQLFKEVEES